MEINTVETTKYEKLRKDSSSSNSSTSTSFSVDEAQEKLKQRKLSYDKKIDKFEQFLSEIEEVETTDRTFMQKVMNYFTKTEKEETNKLLIQDENRTIEEIITSKGFKCEKHLVKTEDGYNLTIFRIPGNKNCSDGSGLQPVLLQHGVFDSSDCWVCNGEYNSVAFLLASHNFDVWLSNSRGNKYCKSHDKYNSDSFEFWQYSFHDLGLYDIPAVIEYINQVNKSGEKIIYFGHSQGTTLMFSGMVEKYDFYKKNIKLFVALAPIARLNHLGSTLLNILKSMSLHKYMSNNGIYELCPQSEGTSNCLSYLRKNANGFTNFFISLISDSNSKECNDQNALSVYFKHYPCGTSLKCLEHYIHIIEAKKFIHYDYGKEANYNIYHQRNPKEYDLSVIKDIPIMLITGDKDKLATIDDVRWLYNELKSNVIYFNIESNMGHLSFICGKDISWLKEPLDIILDEFCPKSK
jgi:lysosomal acid lipase/cholesteryl ester hydrolase